MKLFVDENDRICLCKGRKHYGKRKKICCLPELVFFLQCFSKLLNFLKRLKDGNSVFTTQSQLRRTLEKKPIGNTGKGENAGIYSIPAFSPFPSILTTPCRTEIII